MVLPLTKYLLSVVSQSLKYDPETGQFTWMVQKNSFRGRSQIGATAGTPHDGYVVIGINRKQYRAHRLAWLIMTGADVPKGKEIDHINRDRADNRWCNLRLIDRTRNNHNSAPHRNNTSGVKGVSWVARDGKWDARIKSGGKIVLLGRYERFKDAVAARVEAEKQILGESPSAATGVPDQPKTPRIKEQRPRWIDENREKFRENRALKIRRSNSSGCPGVRLHKASGLWQVRIVVQGKELSLGYFREITQAVEARLAAERQHFGRTHRD